MSDFHLLGNWTESIDPELQALKGFSVLLQSASTCIDGEIEGEDLSFVSVLHSQLVKDLETRLKELDKESQELQRKKGAA